MCGAPALAGRAAKREVTAGGGFTRWSRCHDTESPYDRTETNDFKKAHPRTSSRKTNG